jgi:hypothetical protein
LGLFPGGGFFGKEHESAAFVGGDDVGLAVAVRIGEDELDANA